MSAIEFGRKKYLQHFISAFTFFIFFLRVLENFLLLFCSPQPSSVRKADRHILQLVQRHRKGGQTAISREDSLAVVVAG